MVLEDAINCRCFASEMLSAKRGGVLSGHAGDTKRNSQALLAMESSFRLELASWKQLPKMPCGLP